METVVYVLLWVVAGIVYLNTGWLISEWIRADRYMPRWLKFFLDGPAVWDLNSKFTGKSGPKLLNIILGVPVMAIVLIILAIVWTCYFTFGGGIVRAILNWKKKKKENDELPHIVRDMC